MDLVKRFEVWSIDLNPTQGHEINKIRPCVIISPNESNKYLKTVIMAPLTSSIKNYPTRLNCSFNGNNGQIMLDQIRGVDKIRLKTKIGEIDTKTAQQLCDKLQVLFQY